MPQTGTEWVASLEELSDEPLRRSAQIALAAIDRHMNDDGEYGDGHRLAAAYEALQAALAA